MVCLRLTYMFRRQKTLMQRTWTNNALGRWRITTTETITTVTVVNTTGCFQPFHLLTPRPSKKHWEGYRVSPASVQREWGNMYPSIEQSTVKWSLMTAWRFFYKYTRLDHSCFQLWNTGIWVMILVEDLLSYHQARAHRGEVEEHQSCWVELCFLLPLVAGPCLPQAALQGWGTV